MLEDVTERIKRVPPVAWLIGGLILVAFLFLRGSGGGSSTPSPSGGTDSAGGGGGGGDVTTGDNLSMAITDLASQLQANAAADAAFQKTITDKLNAAKPSPASASVKYGSTVASRIRLYTPASLTTALKKAGVNPGSQIDLPEIKLALKREHINYGSTVDPIDILHLFQKTHTSPVKVH